MATAALDALTREEVEARLAGSPEERAALIREGAEAGAPAAPQPSADVAPKAVAVRRTLSPSYAGGQVEPRARKLAKDSGIDLAVVPGSGPGGRITEEDVRAAIAGASSA